MSDGIEFVPEDEGDNNVKDFLKEVVHSNIRLIGQLNLLGHQITPVLHLQAAVETILDIMLDTDEERFKYETAVEVNLHHKLERLLAAATKTIDVEPS